MSAVHAAPTQRDLRLDFIRGVALLCIFIDHIPGNPFAALTLQRFSFMDAAEVFVFVSGYVSGLVYTRALVHHGFLACAKKALRRCAQIYVAQIALVVGICVVLYEFAVHGIRVLPEFSDTYVFMDHPVKTAAAALTLSYAPWLAGLLKLYIVLLAVVPCIVYALQRRPKLVIACAVLLYVFVQFIPEFNLYSHYPEDRPWIFNPFAWQIVFVLGLLIGNRRFAGARWPGFPPRSLVVAACLGLALIAGARIVPSPTLARLLDSATWSAMTNWIPLEIPFTEKIIAAPLRLANLVLFVIAVAAIGPARRFWSSALAQPFTLLGSHSLTIYSLSVVLSYLVMCLAAAMHAGIPAYFVLTLGGCLIMLSAARIAEASAARPWLRRAAKPT